MAEQKRIPCPGCATRKRLSIDNERWRPCEMCGAVRDGTIPDRRAHGAADRAVERKWCLASINQYNLLSSASIMAIIREEAERG